MKKIYFAPALEVVNVKSDAVLQNFSNKEAASDAEVYGKNGMTPVSDDNASSLWED